MEQKLAQSGMSSLSAQITKDKYFLTIVLKNGKSFHQMGLIADI